MTTPTLAARRCSSSPRQVANNNIHNNYTETKIDYSFADFIFLFTGSFIFIRYLFIFHLFKSFLLSSSILSFFFCITHLLIFCSLFSLLPYIFTYLIICCLFVCLHAQLHIYLFQTEAGISVYLSLPFKKKRKLI